MRHRLWRGPSVRGPRRNKQWNVRRRVDDGRALAHVVHAQLEEHVRVGVLERGEVDVFLERLVLRPELREAAVVVRGSIEGGR